MAVFLIFRTPNDILPASACVSLKQNIYILMLCVVVSIVLSQNLKVLSNSFTKI